MHNDNIASLHLLSFQTTNLSPTKPNPEPPLNSPNSLIHSLPHEIQQLLLTYSNVFNTPQGLPHSHPYDHHIPLLPNTTLVNVKPYRYPYSQKEATTTIINDILQDGITQPTTNPFSSPVLLVKKMALDILCGL